MKPYDVADYGFGGFGHIPVLPREVVELFGFGDAEFRLIDGTLGGGGHSSLLLKANPRARLLGIDRDDVALAAAADRLAFAGDRVTLVKGEFGNLYELAIANGFADADGVLLDIGVSSPQLDEPERGFSWRNDGPLDMRMDRRQRLTAADLVRNADERELARIFRDYGEIHSARKLAAAVVTHRKSRAFATTTEFADFCEEILGRTAPGKLPLPTLVFQALRIAVNGELEQLERGLDGALHTLKVGGILAVISFHSLEDHIVKNFIRDAAKDCVCPAALPVCVCGKKSELKAVNRKLIMAAEDELEANRRAAPARLRAAAKL